MGTCLSVLISVCSGRSPIYRWGTGGPGWINTSWQGSKVWSVQSWTGLGFPRTFTSVPSQKKKEKKGQEGVGRRFPDAPGQCRGPLTDHLDDPSAVRDSESLFLITARPLPPPCGPPGWRQGPELPWQLGVPQWLAFHLCCPLKLSLSLGCGLSTGTASSH